MHFTKTQIAIAFAMAIFFGCGNPSPESEAPKSSEPTESAASSTEKPTFAFVTNNASNFWAIAKKGLDKAEEDFDIIVDFQQPPTGTIADQRRIIENLLNKGIDGISVSPIDAENQSDFLKEVADQVPLLCHDSDAPQSGRLAYVGTNNFKAGVEAGKLIKEVLPEGGQIMLFVGLLDAQNAQDRKAGIEKELEGSGIEILDTRTDGVDTAKARANAEDAMVSNPDLDCLVGLWSYNGPALADAVKGSNKVGDIDIVCFDEDGPTLQAIQDGIIHGTVVQQPYQMGYQSMALLKKIHDEGAEKAVPEGGVIDTGVQIVRKDNVEQFWADLKKLTGED
ncbi:MAG: sugar-binding protein [Candidatus Omnitrophica bacterium]|nr:sugar-binding protein [Candidatus Omnitrophota bacterium]